MLEVNGLGEDRKGGIFRSEVFDERDAAVFVANDEIKVSVAIPIESGGRDHLDVHDEWVSVAALEFDSVGVDRFRAGAGVLEVGEAVEKFAAEEIEVAVAIEVAEVGRGPAVDIDGGTAGVDFEARFGIAAGFVFDEVDPAVKRAVLPTALCVVGVIPNVVGPVAHACDEVQVAVAFPVDKTPHAGAGFGKAYEFVGGVDLFFFGERVFAEVDELVVLLQDAGFAVDITDLHIVPGLGEVDAGFEDGKFDGRILRRIFKKVDSIARFVRAGNDEVVVAILVVVHRHGPGPEPDTQIDG